MTCEGPSLLILPTKVDLALPPLSLPPDRLQGSAFVTLAPGFGMKTIRIKAS